MLDVRWKHQGEDRRRNNLSLSSFVVAEVFAAVARVAAGGCNAWLGAKVVGQGGLRCCPQAEVKVGWWRGEEGVQGAKERCWGTASGVKYAEVGCRGRSNCCPAGAAGQSASRMET